MKYAARLVFGIGFILAGIFHFVNPEFYYPMMPGWFPAPEVLNFAAGLAEVVLGAALLYRPWARMAAVGIIVLMVLFIPVHVYMIQAGGCVSDEVCLPLWGAWVRLVVLHPLLIAFTWWVKPD